MSTNSQTCTRATRRGLVLAGLCLLGFASPAHAYLDPGSVSIIVTAILGAIAAIGYTGRLYWERLKAFVRRTFSALKRDKQHPGGD